MLPPLAVTANPDTIRPGQPDIQNYRELSASS